MRVVFLTADEPLYLPAFFARVLEERAADTAAVCLVPPLYKGQSKLQATMRYYRTFGLGAAVGLTARIAAARLRTRSIAAVAEKHHVPTRPVRDVNSADFLDWLSSLEPDVIVSVSCPQIFGTRLLALPGGGCLNIHGAILPNYRGVMPSFWMLANAEKEAGVSVYFMNEQIDAGDVCVQRTFEIEANETLDRFLTRSKAIAADAVLDALQQIEDATVQRRPLDLAAGSYYSWPDRSAVERFRSAGRRLW